MSVIENIPNNRVISATGSPAISPASFSEQTSRRSELVLSELSIQSPLNSAVQDALGVLERTLAHAPSRRESLLARGIGLSPINDEHTVQDFVLKLSLEIESLYFTPSESGLPHHISERWYDALEILYRHLCDVASALRSDGYESFSVVATRNSFADRWHLHTFATYILYCGRETGTEVLLEDPRGGSSSIVERKNSWMRRSHDVVGINEQRARIAVSDTTMGLLLPPDVAHRACPATSSEGKELPNLALVLMAFRGT